MDTPAQPQWHHLFGAYSFVTHEIIARSAAKRNRDGFVAFLDTLVQHLPDDRPVLLVLDNASYPLRATTQAGLAAFEARLRPFFLPPYCSNLNRSSASGAT